MQLTSLNSKREVLTKIKRTEVKVSLAKLQKKSRYWYIYIYQKYNLLNMREKMQ
jgi:hypothetical protein